ncbi:MAG: hypothetical protein XU15_C0026G0018 [candidate division NC10 bacterium CSP1-5]|nr:MAG: hypothetical protein XU15_C0026G0018 [candidate division NC10 bacterium CSP1-5]
MARKRKLRGVEKARKLVRGYQAGGQVPLSDKVFDVVNKARLSARETALGLLGINPETFSPGMGGPGDPRALAQHEQTSKLLTKKLVSLGVPKPVAGTLVSGAGNINETLSGVINVATGGQFFDPQGFDMADLIANERGIAAVRPAIPQIGFQRGGQVAGKTRATIRVPARALLQRFQAGGEVSNVIPNLFTGFGGLQANTGAQRGITRQLRQFDPFGGPVGGAAQGTLTGLLQTGLPTDVGALTDVAQARAGRTFQDLTGGINEQLGALGLGSSSARTSALARAAGNLSAQVGETGILGGLQAREAATGRQLSALGPGLDASGQRLSALGTAGGVAGQAAGQELQARSTGLGGQSGLAQSLLPTLGNEMNLGPAGGGFMGGGGSGAIRRGIGSPGINTFSVGSPRFQAGGRVGSAGRGDLGDFLSNLLFGRQFTRRAPLPQAQFPVPRGGFAGSDDFMRSIRAAEEERQRRLTEAELARRRQPVGRRDVFDPLAFVERLGQATRGPFGAMGTGIGQPTDFQRGALQLGGGLGDFLRTSVPRMNVGGKIRGPSVPPDSVPILAQGGEGVLHVNLMSELEKSKSRDPLVKKMKKLMGFQAGGQVPTFTNEDLLSAKGNVSELGVPSQSMDPREFITRAAQDARRRADLTRAAALFGPRGAAINAQVDPTEAAALQAASEVAGLAQRETPIKQEVTSRRVVSREEEEEAQQKAAQDEAKRIRGEADSVLKAARASQDKGGQLNFAQAREDLEIRGIDPASVFPGFETAERRQQEQIARAQREQAEGLTGQLQPEFVPQLQALEVALEQGGNIPPDQTQGVAQMLLQFVELHKSAGRSDDEIRELVARLFPNVSSVLQ